MSFLGDEQNVYRYVMYICIDINAISCCVGLIIPKYDQYVCVKVRLVAEPAELEKLKIQWIVSCFLLTK